MYKKKTELYGKRLPFGFLKMNIEKVVKKTELTKKPQNKEDTSITKNFDR